MILHFKMLFSFKKKVLYRYLEISLFLAIKKNITTLQYLKINDFELILFVILI